MSTIRSRSVCTALAALLWSGCSGVKVSTHAYTSAMQVNKPVKDEKCYDTAVLLGVDAVRAKDLVKKVLAAVDSTISTETATTIEAQRNRHIGVFVGSGGEELSITLKEIEKEKTFVTVATKTGFVGGAGQKAWSCVIVDKMVEMAAKP